MKTITRTQAVKLTGLRLPYHMNYYLLEGFQFYPNYGDFKMTWAGATGLSAVIGNQKATIAKGAAA